MQNDVLPGGPEEESLDDVEYIKSLASNFHHIDSDGLEKIDVSQMKKILKHDQAFRCSEEIIAKQVRVWALFDNEAHWEISKLIRWNCILPIPRKIIQSRLPLIWRQNFPDFEIRHAPRKQNGTRMEHLYVVGGYYDPYYRTRNQTIMQLSEYMDLREVCQVPGMFAMPSHLLVLDGLIYITYKADHDHHSPSKLAHFSTCNNEWQFDDTIPCFGAFNMCVWGDTLIAIGGKSSATETGILRHAPTNAAWYLRPNNNPEAPPMWTELPPMIDGRLNPCLAIIDDSLYAACGLSLNPDGVVEGTTMINEKCECLENIDSQSWTQSELNFKPYTHSILKDNQSQNIFAIHQERQLEKLSIGTFDQEQSEHKITWKYEVDIPLGCSQFLTSSKLFIFGGLLTGQIDELFPLQTIKMNEDIYSIKREDIDNNNIEDKMVTENIRNEKINLFCCVTHNGQIY